MISFLRRFTTKIIGSETHTITLAAIILAASALLADVLGMLRDRLLAAQFGAGRELDIYNAAFRIPDFIFIILFGSISAAFLPVFSEFRSKNEKDAWRLTNNLLSLGMVIIACLSVLLFFVMPFLMPLISPGFSSDEQDMAIKLSRLLLFSPIFFGISSFFSGILHYFKKFLLFSFAPVIYNLSIIGGVIFLAPTLGVWGVVLGVIFGAFMHMLIQLPGVLKVGFLPRFLFFPLHPGVRETFFLLLPRVPSLMIANLNVIAMTAIATTLSVGSLAIFTFADNLRAVPVGIIGVSFATAVFPNLSQAWAKNEINTFFNILSSVIREVLFLILPLAVLFIVLRAQIVRVILGSGRFDWEDTQLTAAALGLFALGIFAQALIPVFLRAFFAIKDTVTPFVVSIFCVSINIALALNMAETLKDQQSGLFVLFSGSLSLESFSQISVLALPAAFSISAIIQIILLPLAFRIRYGSFFRGEDAAGILKIFLAALACGAVAFMALRPLAIILDLNHFYGIFAQGLIAGLSGGLTYILVSWLLKISELNVFVASFRKQFMPKTIPFSQENITTSSHIK